MARDHELRLHESKRLRCPLKTPVIRLKQMKTADHRPFPQNPVNTLNLAMESPLDYDIANPYADPPNQKAIRKVAKKYGLKTG